MLLTRSPLILELPPRRVRLACVKHAASVNSEPGSNSPIIRTLAGPHQSLIWQIGPINVAPLFNSKNRFFLSRERNVTLVLICLGSTFRF